MSDYEPGVYLDIPNEVYHAQKDAVSNSGLGDMLQSPFHYYSRHLDPARPARKERAGQLEGTLAHCAILEPEEFDKRYVVAPDLNRNSNAWKELAKEYSAAGIIPINQGQYDVAMKQRDAVHSHPHVREALGHGHPEVSAFWIDEETGVKCRCRPDWAADYDSGVVILDVKTYSDASPGEFARQVARKGYARQDAMYSEGFGKAAGVDVLAFLFIAVESSWPHACSVVQLDDDSHNAGYQQYRDALDAYARCIQTGVWPGYSNNVELIRLPSWAINKAEQGLEVQFYE